MINFIKYPKTGTGYIYEKYKLEYTKPDKNRYWTWDHEKHDDWSSPLVRVFKQEKYDNDLKQYEEALAFYNEHKGQYKAGHASKNLIGKTFTFTPGINLIFGPNGSGKTTILKALAGNALIEDGFPTVLTPWTIKHKDWDEDTTLNVIKREADFMKANTCTVDWSGNVIYYDNFANRKSYGAFGDLQGSVLSSMEDEIAWHIGGSKISSGQKTTWLLNKVLHKLESKITIKDLVEPFLKERANDIWMSAYKSSIEYFQQFPDYDKVGPFTLIFDEMDKSLDIETVIYLYKEVLPRIVEKYDCQIIMVSHSPIFLSPYFRNNKNYNIIDIDPEYSRDAMKQMRELYDN